MTNDHNNMEQWMRQQADAWEPESAMENDGWKAMRHSLLFTPAHLPFHKKLWLFAKQHLNLLMGILAVGVVSTLATVYLSRSETKQVAAKPLPITENRVATPDTVKPASSMAVTPMPGQTVSAISRHTPYQNKKTDAADYYDTPISDTASPNLQDVAITREETARQVLNDFFNQIGSKPQYFNINAAQPNTITCAEGTKLYIPANAFINNYGDIASGNVQVMVTEYYDKASFIGAQLFTLSNGRPLISGGMLNIKAVQDRQELRLQSGKKIDLEMPASGRPDPAMQLFSGYYNNSGMLDWRLITPAEPATAPISQVPPRINKDSAAFANWLKYPDMEVNRRNGARFTIPAAIAGSRSRELILDSLNKRYPGYTPIQLTIKASPTDRPRRKLRSRRANTMEMERPGIISDTVINGNTLFNGRFPGNVRPDTVAPRNINNNRIIRDTATPGKQQLATLTPQQNITISDTLMLVEAPSKRNITDSAVILIDSILTNTYRFQLERMGWVNCDRFWDYNGPKTDFVMQIPDDIETAANGYSLYPVTYLLFKKYNAVMPGFVSGKQVRFNNIPQGEEAVIISVAVRDGKPALFHQACKVSPVPVYPVKFEAITPEQFTLNLKKMGMQ